MSRLSTKGLGIKLQIQINEKVIFGKIAYRPEEPISKVLADLKRIKILPEHIEEAKVKYYDRNNQELLPSQEFSLKFNLAEANHLIKINVPENSIDIEETSFKANQYVRINKKKREHLKELSQAENFVRNLKPIFLAIRNQNYQELPNLCENQEFLGVLEDFADEHKRLKTLITLY